MNQPRKTRAIKITSHLIDEFRFLSRIFSLRNEWYIWFRYVKHKYEMRRCSENERLKNGEGLPTCQTARQHPVPGIPD